MSYSEALKEAYASESVDDMPINTLEFHHPDFRDDFGNHTSIRIVQDFIPWTLGLESSAPMNPGEMVLFEPIPFNFNEPSFGEDSVPSITFSVANVSRLLTKHLEEASSKTTPIKMYFRNYTESNTNQPQMNPVIVMTVTSAEAGDLNVTATASLSDVHNWPFPYQKYTPERFPGLQR